MKSNPIVSVIIPTRNSSQFLDTCLVSIKNQTYKNIEIIVVDNNSTDNTKEIAKKYTKLVFNRGPERSAQTNLGIMKANGKYVYRVDSDFILEKKIISEAVERCEKNNLDGIAVHNTSAPGLGFWSKVRKLERDTYQDDTLIVGVRFYKKTVWKSLNGYNEEIVWDDYDFHNRYIAANFKWGRIKSKEYHLGEPRDLLDIAKKSFFYGKEMVAYLKLYPSRAIKQANPLRFSYIRHWKEFIKNPILTLGFVLMLVVKYGAGMVGFTRELLTISLKSKKFK